MSRWINKLPVALILAATLACGGDGPTDPPDAVYGETTVVYVVNPVINDVNAVTVAAPGSVRSGVQVAVTGGPNGSTGSTGDVALAPVPVGARAVSFTAGATTGQMSLDIADGDLREIAIALDGAGAATMADVRYAFGGTVVEITPAMPIAEVNTALAGSNLIVFLGAGTYTGNLVFSGSNVTLFGEGAQGGGVIINGNVTVTGSGNRFRGARIVGNLSVGGSGAGISYSRVDGALTVDGSNAVLLNNQFCGTVAVPGSGMLALGNAGLAPIAAPSGC